MLSVNQRWQLPTHHRRNGYFQYSTLKTGPRNSESGTAAARLFKLVSSKIWWRSSRRCSLWSEAGSVLSRQKSFKCGWSEMCGFYLLVELTGLDGPEKQDKRTNLELSSEDHNVLLPAWGLLALWCAGAWPYTLGWLHPRSVYPQVHVTWVLRNLGNVETFPSTGKTFSR